MNDLQTINDIVEQSIKDSSYVSVLISSGVFIVYTLINKLVDLFKTKSRNKPLLEMAEAIKEVSSNVVKLNGVLDKTFQDAQRKEITKVKQVISLAFNTFQNTVSRECVDMIINNHIESNKQLITENITKLISTEYYKLYSMLSAYELNGKNIADKLDKNCIDDITNSVLSIMFNGQEQLNRIAQLNSRLNVDVNRYATHVDNKVFND